MAKAPTERAVFDTREKEYVRTTRTIRTNGTKRIGSPRLESDFGRSPVMDSAIQTGTGARIVRASHGSKLRVRHNCTNAQSPPIRIANNTVQMANSATVCTCRLTTELSGRYETPFRTGEHAIYCEHGAATMTAGPLERI
jgi:hypothetical protein